MAIAGAKLERPAKLASILDLGLNRKPHEAALVSLERTWSWLQLDQAAARLAGNYRALGLAAGDRVASLMPNRGVLLVHYLACFKAGLIATPLNYRYQAPEIDHALEVSGAALIVAHVERDDVLTVSRQAARLPLGRIHYGAQDGPQCLLEEQRPLEAQRRLEDLITHDGPASDFPAPSPETPAFIFFTSGSTGKPKGVTHSHESFGWMVASAVAGLTLTPADIFLPATSASHIAATSLAFAGLSAGACVVIARSFDAGEVLPLLRNMRPSMMCILPAPLFGVIRDQRTTREDFQSIRRCLSGGDKISTELEREFTGTAGFAIEELYGMTETGTSAINPPGGLNQIGSIGRLAPGYTASIRNDAGVEVPAGTPGRLWIQSPSNMVGYWNRPDATAETIVDGWLDTGDLVAADHREYLWFRGRKKQIIVHDGSNICPQEVEDSLLEHPAVANAGVVGIHDAIHGENVRAYITFRPNAAQRPPTQELIQFSRARVGYKAPDEILVLETMPSNAVGKVDRSALKQMADAANDHSA